MTTYNEGHATMRTLDRPKLHHCAELFANACKASREHSDLARVALAVFGDHGAQISGCVREHFPEHVKDDLRFLATQVSRWTALAYEHRPRGIRKATLRRLSQEIATRDGAGFYGPQPMRFER